MQKGCLVYKMLTNRLETVKNLVKNSKCLLDVGTDHGYVPISLIMEKRAEKVIGADINKGPLDNAKKNVALAGLLEKIELRLGSGMVPAKLNEVDTVIIAGMGGILIADIIKESYEKAQSTDKLILQPMYSQDALRSYLVNNNFKIIKEYLAKENEKIYNIIEVAVGCEEKDYSKKSFLLLGHPDNFIKDENYFYYIEKRKSHYKKVLENLKNAKIDKEEEKDNLRELLSDLEKYYG